MHNTPACRLLALYCLLVVFGFPGGVSFPQPDLATNVFCFAQTSWKSWTVTPSSQEGLEGMVVEQQSERS